MIAGFFRIITWRMNHDDRWSLNHSNPGHPEHATNSVSDQHGASVDSGSFSCP